MTLTAKGAFDPYTATEYNELLTRLQGFSTVLKDSTGSTSFAAAAGTYTTLTGLSQNVTIAGGNAYALIWMFVQLTPTVTASSNTLAIVLDVDGASVARGDPDDRVSSLPVTLFARVALAAGVHTILGRAARVGGGTFSAPNGRLMIDIRDVP